jgi:L-alanine-DL-glutamate epimerase-like enolase superfamily enzyme
VRQFDLCEFPVELSELAAGLTTDPIALDGDGRIRLPSGSGLGVTINRNVVRRYLQPVVIKVRGRILYRSPVI